MVTKIKQSIIFIDGYWVRPDGIKTDTFKDKKCIIGKWDGKEDDKDSKIFYYFDREIDLELSKINNGTGEFVVTTVRTGKENGKIKGNKITGASIFYEHLEVHTQEDGLSKTYRIDMSELRDILKRHTYRLEPKRVHTYLHLAKAGA